MSATGPVTVREIATLLRRRQARALTGESGLTRVVTWASVMRARLPAFDGFQGGELALLSLATLRSLRAQVAELTLPHVVEQLAEIGVSALAVAGLDPPPPHGAPPAGQAARDAREREEATQLASASGVALLALPAGAPLAEIEREVIAHIVARRDHPAPEPPGAEPADSYAARLRESLRGEALDALLSGAYAGEAAMRAHAAQLGYDLSQPHVALWVELRPGPAGSRRPLHTTARHLAEELSAALGAWARARDGQVVALLLGGREGARVPAAAQGDYLERATALLTRALGGGLALDEVEWSAGLGEPATSPAQTRRSAAEARDAAQLGLLVLGARRVARPGDLGVYRLLLALRESGDLAPFVEQTLSPLLADTRSGDALIETLEAFFTHNGNLSEAARSLHLHRNSLIYRLNRARELLGHDLEDPELRLALQLALKAQRVLAMS